MLSHSSWKWNDRISCGIRESLIRRKKLKKKRRTEESLNTSTHIFNSKKKVSSHAEPFFFNCYRNSFSPSIGCLITRTDLQCSHWCRSNTDWECIYRINVCIFQRFIGKITVFVYTVHANDYSLLDWCIICFFIVQQATTHLLITCWNTNHTTQVSKWMLLLSMKKKI